MSLTIVAEPVDSKQDIFHLNRFFLTTFSSLSYISLRSYLKEKDFFVLFQTFQEPRKHCKWSNR